jgi:hypothetical protein
MVGLVLTLQRIVCSYRVLEIDVTICVISAAPTLLRLRCVFKVLCNRAGEILTLPMDKNTFGGLQPVI